MSANGRTPRPAEPQKIVLEVNINGVPQGSGIPAASVQASSSNSTSSTGSAYNTSVSTDALKRDESFDEKSKKPEASGAARPVGNFGQTSQSAPAAAPNQSSQSSIGNMAAAAQRQQPRVAQPKLTEDKTLVGGALDAGKSLISKTPFGDSNTGLMLQGALGGINDPKFRIFPLLLIACILQLLMCCVHVFLGNVAVSSIILILAILFTVIAKVTSNKPAPAPKQNSKGKVKKPLGAHKLTKILACIFAFGGLVLSLILLLT